MEIAAVAPSRSEMGVRVKEVYRRARTALPPMRLIWILLAALGTYGVYFLGGTVGASSLLVLPLVALLTDLGFSRIRFESVRFPDAAITTGLFVALILPPTVPLVGAGALCVAAIAVKHTLRYRGRPWFNPAVVAIILGAVLFGFSPAWWGSISVVLVLALGAVLLFWNYRDWRLPVTFLLAYAGLALLQRVALALASGGTVPSGVLVLAALDPAILFFGLFMVVEPRTSPSDRRLQPLYAVLAAAGSALLPLVLPTLAVFVALLGANAFAVGVRATAHSTPQAARAGPRPAATEKRGARAKKGSSDARWSLGRRVTAGLGIFAVVLIIAGVSSHAVGTGPPLLPSAPGGGSGGGVGAVACQNDNPSIPASTLASLHHALGPSTILQYNAQTGVVVFYDPVNSVTVSETDLFEDFGFAEFNGDDYAAAGCVP